MKNKLRKFNKDENSWMCLALSLLSPKVASQYFLFVFPDIYLHSELPKSEVQRIVYQRFRNTKKDSRRKTYHIIQENIKELETLKAFYSFCPIINDLYYLAFFVNSAFDPKVKSNQDKLRSIEYMLKTIKKVQN